MHRIITLLTTLLVLTAAGLAPAFATGGAATAIIRRPAAEVGGPAGMELRAAPAAVAGDPFPCTEARVPAGRLKDTGLVDCLEYANLRLNGADYRVLYPVEWQEAGGWGTEFLAPTAEAVEVSVAVFGELGSMASVNVFFALLPGDGSAQADAGFVSVATDLPCSIIVYGWATGYTVEAYRQTIAHELFHCFQAWNFHTQATAASSNAWWVEGTAEYFSNVVYPGVNDEWKRIPEFDAGSANTPLTQMAYETSVFWQYVGNAIGNEGILNLIGALPGAGGEAEQQAALRTYPGFADLFQGFAQAYLDKKIVDTSGALLPVKPVVNLPRPPIAESTTVLLEPAPFVLYRHGLTLAAEPTFAIATEVAGGQSRLAVRRLDEPGQWDGAMVPAVDCDGPHRFVTAFTTLATPPEDDVVARYVITATPDACEPGATDPCLVGIWEVVDFETTILASYAATNAGPQLTYQGTSGSLVYVFDGKEVTLAAEAFEIRIGAEIAGTAADIVIRMNGVTSAPYHLAPGGGSGTVDQTPSEISVLVRVILDGSEVYAGDVPELWQLVGGPFAYACDGDRLELSVAGPDGELLPPVVLMRQS